MNVNGLILVSGLARCGTSLMMQMLSAGGWPIYGPKESVWPSFEHPAAMEGRQFPPEASGLIKWLIPVVPVPPELTPPTKITGTVFLTRDPLQQAKSHLKFLKFMGLPIGDVDVRAYAETFRQDAPVARAALAASGPVIDVTFEDLISGPGKAMEAVASFFSLPLGIDRAISQVRARRTGARCLPNMMEAEMIEEEGHR